jgi:sugar O-acyltransferase (sialic acid O-acetyltransferase NeuD family)
MKTSIWIYGAGGMGSELKWLIEESCSSQFEIEGFVDDFKSETLIFGLPLIPIVQEKSNIALGIADPTIKEKIYKNINSRVNSYPNILHSSVVIDKSNEIGVGNIFCKGVVLTVYIKIGNHVIININSTIGHNSEIGDYCTLLFGVHISGNVKIGKGTLIGSNAVVLPNLTIGQNCIIGAGAVVTTNIPDNSVVVGVPGKVIKKNLAYE